MNPKHYKLLDSLCLCLSVCLSVYPSLLIAGVREGKPFRVQRASDPFQFSEEVDFLKKEKENWHVIPYSFQTGFHGLRNWKKKIKQQKS